MILLKLFFTFFKIGLFTFGGGYAMLPLIQEEVAANGWLADDELINFIAVSESTPGPFAVNISTYVGMQTAGFAGAICSTLGVVLPSFIVILIVARFYDKFRKARVIQGCMSGLKPAVIGLIAAAAVSIAVSVFFSDGFSTAVFATPEFYVSVAIFAVTAVLSFAKIKIHPIVIICLSAVAGIIAGYALKL